MNIYGQSQDQEPMMWVRGRPVYAAYLIVLIFVASMIATAVLMSLNLAQSLRWLVFDSPDVLAGQVWRIGTYGLVNPPSLFPFALDMLMLVWFGREVEKGLGRRKFLLLFGCLYLLPALLFTLIGVWHPTRLAGETGQLAGESGTLAVFVAFATLFPEALLMFGIVAKWAAVAFVGIDTLIVLAYRDWLGGLALWSTAGFAYAFIRFEQGRFYLPRLRLFRKEPKFRVLPGYRDNEPEPVARGRNESMAELDALLDKIARSGVSSLTAKERIRLDSARNELLKRQSRR
ncbi:MAG TPA: rhomboid family intramembrane serine protease [Opitutaceae bacterium]|jgi:membrane associated rhomboid family serine protease